MVFRIVRKWYEDGNDYFIIEKRRHFLGLSWWSRYVPEGFATEWTAEEAINGIYKNLTKQEEVVKIVTFNGGG